MIRAHALVLHDRGPMGHMAVVLLDGPHAGTTWYTTDYVRPLDTVSVRYYPEDQFVHCEPCEDKHDDEA